MATQLETGPPWNVTCALERAGDGLACELRIEGGGAPARARSVWSGARASSIGRDPGWQGEIARSAAHRLCRSARVAVRCDVALGELDENDGLSAAVRELVQRASRCVEDRRIRGALEEPGSVHRLVSEEARRLLPRVEAFLSTPFEDLAAEHGARAARVHAAGFGGRVQLFAPLYLTNACLNDCAYCGFRQSATFARTHLSTERAIAEALRLAEAGHRTIDLVTGEIPTGPFVRRVAEVVRRVRAETPIGRIHLNLGALSEEQYGELRRAGAAGYHLYQETYDAETYLRLHRSGPKRDMAHRLEAPRRVLRAGFPAVGLGILLGLRSPALELASLAAHAHLLEREFPGARLGFSLPRWRGVDATCDFVSEPVGDGTFAAALLFLRLEFPGAHLTLTTREGAGVRDRLLPFGITRISAGVSTAPGGYGGKSSTEQFSVHDRRPLEVVEARILALGGTPVRG